MKGRPGKDEVVETVYFVDSPLEIIPDVIEQEKTRLGRFILATNDLDLDPDSILKCYKGQQSVERGFRFLKDKSFRVAEVFLKKETRIEALSIIMVLCLFVYAVAEWHLRTRLKETKTTVKNQLKKPIQNPTMKWIFTLFMRPADVIVTLNSQIQRFIVNLDDEVTQILALMGPAFEKYYFVRSTREILEKLSCHEFVCELDSLAAAGKWVKNHPRYQFKKPSIVPVRNKTQKGRGRPKTGEPVTVSYMVNAEIEHNPEFIQQEKRNLWRFVLASNDLELSPDTLLGYYKVQGTVERGFRFLKDKSFRVSEVYLKKNSRIQALAMIMLLCLFIYSMVEFRLRQALERTGETLISQTNKQTQRPTLKWVFSCFGG